MAYKYKKFFSSFSLKIIAFFAMTLDHIGAMMEAYGVGNTTLTNILRYLGKLAFPLVCFLLAIGMRKSSNKNKYLGRIFILGISLTVVEIIAVHLFPENLGKILRMENNPLLDLMASALLLYALSYLRKGNGKKVFLSLLGLLPIVYITLSSIFTFLDYQNYIAGESAFHSFAESSYFLPYYLRAGYGILGMLLSLSFYYVEPIVNHFTKKNCQALEIDFEMYKKTSDYRHASNLLSMLFFLLIVVIMWGFSYLGMTSDGLRPYNYNNMSIEAYCLLAMPFIYFYNGEKGYDFKGWKIIEYLYFPAHLAIIYLIFSVLY